MDINIDVRRKQLENLDQFISSSKDRVDSILDYLGWNAEKISKNQKETVKCPINPSHRIPTTSLNNHMQKCSWRKENYDKDDIPLSEPNPIPGSTIIIDDLTKVNVLNSALAVNPHMKTGWRSSEPEPKSSNRLLVTFTPDERLALYDFASKTTKGPPQVPEFNVEPKIVEKHNLTPYELKALERDAKRRRMKYRTKSVHMNSKSHTEILREIIDGQMELYEEWVQDKNGTPIKKVTPNKTIKKETVVDEDDVKGELKTTEMKQEVNDKEHEHDEKLESSNEPSSPKSSRSQNSFKSQESRHKSRRRSPDRSRDRSRSRSRKRDYRKDSRHDYSSRRRYDDRHSDRDRKYNYKRNSREFKTNRSEH